MIKIANETHLNEILDIEKLVFIKPWSRKQLKNDLTLRTNAENWVYLKDKKVAGYILGRKVMDEFHLNNIAVLADFQRKHIGRSLIEHLCVRLQHQGIQRVYLEVSVTNIPAQKLYKSLGFQQKGIRRDYYAIGDHALLYHLEIVENG